MLCCVEWLDAIEIWIFFSYCRLSWSSRVSAPWISFFLLLFLLLFFLLQAVMNLTTGIRTLNFNNDGQMLLMASQAKKEALRYSKFTRDFTCFTGTKVQILTLRTLRILHTATSLLVQKYKYWCLLCWYKNANTDAAHLRILHTATSSVYPNWPTAGTQFTCFTGKKLPILTLQASRHASPLGF